MMGSERVVGTHAADAAEVSGIVPQSLVELFRLLDERAEAGSGDEDEAETWKVRVGYLQVLIVFSSCVLVIWRSAVHARKKMGRCWKQVDKSLLGEPVCCL